MKATFKLEGVDRMEATLTLTTTVGEWRRLRGTLPEHGPPVLYQLRNSIYEVIRRAEFHFEVEPGDDPQPTEPA